MVKKSFFLTIIFHSEVGIQTKIYHRKLSRVISISIYRTTQKKIFHNQRNILWKKILCLNINKHMESDDPYVNFATKEGKKPQIIASKNETYVNIIYLEKTNKFGFNVINENTTKNNIFLSIQVMGITVELDYSPFEN